MPVRHALVLAAGNGDRFQTSTGTSKLLQPVLGRPLIIRTLETARDAGVMAFDVVLGYQADKVAETIERYRPSGTTVRFSFNPDWHSENGVSAMTAREHCGIGRFALLMGDHLFDADVLSRALATGVAPGESLLAVDSRPAPDAVAAEATRVRLAGDYVVAIGKNLEPFDALDTGLFVCDPVLFDAVGESIASGDTTLSGGIRRLAARGLMRSLDIGDARWFDIDTPADLEVAEALLTVEPEHA